ncbi:NADH-quinone oxidoreductase subunit L [Demetria terragena]|uniref:NADH-quinone oxidoreductase subunit 5 family protein n=1 Tax=Demetria terragena TaxID=63959 RepID=UPI00035C14FA|nr:NADH-quinone oxidoreductase subunit L [Demetria terragena]
MNLALDGALQPSHAVILLPALGGLLTLPLVRHSSRAAAAVALIANFLGLLAALWLLIQVTEDAAIIDPETVGALALGPALDVPLQLHLEGWNVLVAVVVAVVSFVVQAFARWYLWDDQRYRQFAATVGLFTAGMQLVVLSGDLLLTLVGWELMGWCSYLLIGHESEREKARRAAFKAFLVTRLADAPLVVGFAALAMGARSTSLEAVVDHWSAAPLAGGTALTAALLGVICGVLGKSAQVPFQDWLPDAMEGPTPASALIHAATMVAAGTIVLADLLPLLQEAPAARTVLLVFAGFSSILAALLAVLQTDLKRLLAWSTVSQVGLMLGALSLIPDGAGPDLAITHLVSHAAFKALLFLMIGWLSVLVGGTVVARMSGGIRRYPQTRFLLAVGLLALAGVPPTVGFVSKDLILEAAAEGVAEGQELATAGFFVVGVVIVLTAAYSMRAWLVIQHRTVFQRRVEETTFVDSRTVAEVSIVEMLREAPQVDALGQPTDEVEATPGPEEADPEPTSIARLGLRLLGLLSLLGGLVVASPLIELDWRHANLLLIAAGLLFMTAAALLVRIMSLRTTYGDAAERAPLAWRSAASRSLGIDTVYVALVAQPVLALARTVHRAEAHLDRGVSGLSTAARTLGDRGSAVHRRTPSSGLVALLAGTLAVALLGVILW